MKNHIYVEHNDANFKIVPLENGQATCLSCNMTFSSRTSAKSHYKQVHLKDKNNRVICPFCFKTFSNIDGAKQHCKYVHMTNQTVRNHVCTVCNTRFSLGSYMKAHMRKIHGLSSRILNGTDKLERLQHGWVVCHCCNKTFLSMRNAISHCKDRQLSIEGVETNNNSHKIE